MGLLFEGGGQPYDFRQDQPKYGSRDDNAVNHPVALRRVPMGSGRMEHIGDSHGYETLLDQGFYSMHEH